jgi:hypothetical protein
VQEGEKESIDIWAANGRSNAGPQF